MTSVITINAIKNHISNIIKYENNYQFMLHKAKEVYIHHKAQALSNSNINAIMIKLCKIADI